MKVEHFSFGELLDACRTHDLESLSLAYGLRRDELEALDAAVRGPTAVDRRTTLCPQGNHCKALYVVRTGAFKAAYSGSNGYERIIRFLFAGELLGLDALYDGRHHCTYTALEPSYVFRIPVDRLGPVAQAVPGLQRELLRLAVRQIRDDEEHMLLLEQKPVAARIATYFLHLDRRQNGHDSESRLYLPMTRADLASYLGLAAETLSRQLSQFERDRVIEIPDTRHLILHDTVRLVELAGFEPD